LELIAELHKEFLAEDQDEAKERLKKYVAYGNIIEPLY